MLTRRLIVCLDVKNGRVVKGRQFQQLRDVGDPSEMAVRYEREGADEIVFLDISASAEERATLWHVARLTAERLFIPLTVGGGLRSVDDVNRALRSGADKVSLNSAAVERPRVLTEAADRFGAQCVVASIDAKREGSRWLVHTRGGSRPTKLDAIQWAVECARLGAGEILLTSIDRDGSRKGYDLELTRSVAEAVDVPVIASGGASSAADYVALFRETNADAGLAASIFHYGELSVGDVKDALAAARVPVRPRERVLA